MDHDSSMSAYHGPNGGHYPPSSSATPFRLDEGFSEEALSQDENSRQAFEQLQEWIMAQGEGTRMDIAYEILRTLRTSNIAAVVDRLTPLLHMDPLEKLPPEITGEIFAYLDAHTLMTASLASHTWRGRIIDSRLWQKLFTGQGWAVDEVELRKFENSGGLAKSTLGNRRGKGRDVSDEISQPHHKKRATSTWLDSRERQLSAGVSQWREQHGTVEADTDAISEGSDHEMHDVPTSSQESPSRPNKRHSQDSGDEMDFYQSQNGSTLAQVGSSQHQGSLVKRFRPNLTTYDTGGEQRVNWAYLYKHRRRLEDNWTRGRYQNFQLPDPKHPQEAHTECVYCIQFSGKWLVSGSRDKTLRVWDLETRRLRGRPLTGHSQSVLCLQFDPSEEEDVVISGSSDSSVLVWKFSTGQKIHEIASAHEESVLNLRFDKRFLVTCSKDKKIKVWNRKAISPLDPDYPRIPRSTEHARVPSYIVDTCNMEPSLLEARLANGTIKSLKPYTYLVTFGGHTAAVNAIQIHGDVIVSASGDRMIKIWNVNNGKLLRSVAGHHKGIACVQFDSKRIVSGSSDNTVRIFDPNTGSEVAELKGHTNLVRTVQAGFGDLPGSEAEYLLQAREAEQKYEAEIMAGRVPNDREHRRRVRNGDTGTSRVAFGSTLPPGGGGSRWGKIVSGSYDESIIIWRKNAQGDWTIGLTLRQDAAVRAVRGDRPNIQQAAAVPVQPTTQPPPQPTSAPPTPASAPPAPIAPSHASATAGPSSVVGISPSQIMSQAVNSSFSTIGAGISSVMGIARTVQTPVRINVPPRSSSGNSTTAASSSASVNVPWGQVNSTVQAALADAQAQIQLQRGQNLGGGPSLQLQQQAQAQPPPAPMPHQQHTIQQSHTQNQSQPQNHPQTHHPPAPAQTQNQNQNPNQPQNQPHTQPHTQNHTQNQNQPHNPNPAANGQNTTSVSRVFKLQFDARRIVCCSQDSRIIGWDFANGDRDIEESSKFFLGP
jgi:F-box and WD-40 domain protein 1/11